MFSRHTVKLPVLLAGVVDDFRNLSTSDSNLEKERRLDARTSLKNKLAINLTEGPV